MHTACHISKSIYGRRNAIIVISGGKITDSTCTHSACDIIHKQMVLMKSYIWADETEQVLYKERQRVALVTQIYMTT